MSKRVGDSIDNAIIINEQSTSAGISAEKKFISEIHGIRDIDWEMTRQTSNENNGKLYDILSIQLKTGEEIDYYFDITAFYGK